MIRQTFCAMDARLRIWRIGSARLYTVREKSHFHTRATRAYAGVTKRRRTVIAIGHRVLHIR